MLSSVNEKVRLGRGRGEPKTPLNPICFWIMLEAICFIHSLSIKECKL